MSFLPRVAGTLLGGTIGGQLAGGGSPIGAIAGGGLGGAVASSIFDRPKTPSTPPFNPDSPGARAARQQLSNSPRMGRGSTSLSV